jgi:hypothetical protein
VGAAGRWPGTPTQRLSSSTPTNLEGNDTGDAGARALAESPHLAYLRNLKLNFFGVSRPVQELISHRWPFVQPS